MSFFVPVLLITAVIVLFLTLVRELQPVQTMITDFDGVIVQIAIEVLRVY